MNTDTATGTDVDAGLPGPVVLFISLAAALGTSTIYLLQPAIADVADSLGTQIAAVGLALACGPAGYMVGLGLLVPLVDRFSPARVVAIQFAVLAVCAGVADVWLLGFGTGVVGACSAAGAALSSVAARFAPSRCRATVLGIVTAGISAGILAGRIARGHPHGI